MINATPRGPLVLHVAKLYPKQDGRSFDALGRIISGTLRPGDRVSAVLCCVCFAVLCCAVLCCAVLCCAVLCCALVTDLILGGSLHMICMCQRVLSLVDANKSSASNSRKHV